MPQPQTNPRHQDEKRQEHINQDTRRQPVILISTLGPRPVIVFP